MALVVMCRVINRHPVCRQLVAWEIRESDVALLLLPALPQAVKLGENTLRLIRIITIYFNECKNILYNLACFFFKNLSKTI